MVCHYWTFNHWFKFQDSLCNGCYDLRILCLNISNTANIAVKGVGYCSIIYDISKSEATCLLKNYVLDDSGYI